MKLRIQNSLIVGTTNFLINFELQPKASRMRSRLCRLLETKWTELQAEIGGEKDVKQQQDILEEYSNIDVSEYENLVPVVLAGMENTERTFSGTDAYAYDTIMDILEETLQVSGYVKDEDIKYEQ